MASFTFVLLATSLLVATNSAAPQDTKVSIAIPEQCRGKGFCSIKPEGYDKLEDEINALFPKDLIEVDSRPSSGPIGEPDARVGSDDYDNCPTETTLESVYTYHEPKGTKIDVFVQTKIFPQKITKVTCKYSNEEYNNLNEGGSQCFRTLGLSNFNMESKCVQSYANRTLWVYDPEEEENRRFKLKYYPIPVCCSCVTRKI